MTTARPLSIDMVLDRLRNSRLPFNTRLAARIDDLVRAFADDYEGRSVSTGSVAALVDHLEASPLLSYPDLTLTPSGDCYAEWQDPHGCKTSIEFCDAGEARRWNGNFPIQAN